MRRILFTLSILGAPRAALACPVCFGQNDSPMAWGANMGILAMLIVTVGVLAGFGSFFIYLARRARLVSEASAPDLGPAKTDHGPVNRLRPGYGGLPTSLRESYGGLPKRLRRRKLQAKAEAGRYVRDVLVEPQEGTAQC